MSWSIPKTWGYKETLSSSDMNTYITDNLNALRDGSGIANGAITMPLISNPYKMRAYQNSAWTTPDNVFAKTTLDTNNYDTNNNFSGSTYTVPVTGYYHICGVTGGGAVGRVRAAIYKNGAPAAMGSDNSYFSSVSTELYLTAGDTIELWTFTASAQTGGTGSDSVFLAIHLISKT